MVWNKKAYVFDPRPNYPLVVTANLYTDPDTSAPDDGLTVILAHGTSFTKESWEPVLDDLQLLIQGSSPSKVKIREFWSIEAPNHGDSGVLNEEALKVGYTPIFGWEEYARALHLFLSGYGTGIDVDFSKRTLVGIAHSMGAVSMVLMAGHFPHVKFQSVVLCEIMCMNDKYATIAGNKLVGGAAKRRDIWPTREDAYNIFKSRGTWKAWDDRVLRNYVETGFRDIKDKDGNPAITFKCSREQETATYRDMLGPSRAYRLLKHWVQQVPTHMIYGGIDDYLPAEGKEDILNTIGGKQNLLSFARVPNGGHLLPQMNPTGLAKELYRCLQVESSKVREAKL